MALSQRNALQKRLTVGVLGGMGPEATIDFMSQVVALTPADNDQDHIPMLVDSNCAVPDRQHAMKSGDRAPVSEALVEMAQRLEAAGADFLVMPCNTAHAFVGDAEAAVKIPLVSIIDVTVDAALEAASGSPRIGLLATDACIAADVYAAVARARGLTIDTPDAATQERLMSLIFRVKAGDARAGVRDGMRAVAGRLIDSGVGALIAGCTEIPLVLRPADVEVPFVSSTEALAQRTVAVATGKLALTGDAAQ